MLDIKFIRDNSDLVNKAAKNKNVKIDVDQLLKLDEQRRELLTKIGSLREERNKKSKGKPTAEEIIQMRKVGDEVKRLEAELGPVEQEWNQLMLKVPNVPWEDVQIGKSEEENQVV